MVENRERRELLRDTAVAVLAADGVHGLTHRRVDQKAGVPGGTTKNYYPTRDSLLRAAAERSYQRYLDDVAMLEAAGGPRDRAELVVLVAELIRRGIGPDRVRLVATLELHAEATRNEQVRAVLGELVRTDFALYERLQRSAGLPTTRQRTHAVTRCLHAALLSLLTQPPDALRDLGLDDLEGFVAGVLATVYPQ